MKSQLKSSYVVLILLMVGLAVGNELPPWAQKIPIAIPDLEANGISQTEVIALTDRLRNELFRLGEFDVVERGLMEDILAEQDFQLSGCTSDECLVEVGRLMGAQQVVGGRISRIGDLYTVSARVVDVESGKVLGVSDYDLQGGLEEMLTVGMEQVARGLAGRAEAEAPEEVAEVSPIKPTTATVEPEILVGLKGGLNMAGVAGVSSGMSAGGLVAGGFVDYPIVNKWWVGCELLYSTKGFSSEGTVTLNYLDVPIRLIFAFDNRAKFYVGPYLSIFLKGRTDVDGEKISMDSDQVTRLDYGITFGASYSLGKLILETRYTTGITPVFTTADIADYGPIDNYDNTANVLMQVLIGYGL